MVFKVAGEAVDLVDDDIGDRPVITEVGEHLLKAWSIGGLGGVARVDVFTDERPALLRDEPPAGFYLSLKRVATLRLVPR